jgi:hypothetical protein
MLDFLIDSPDWPPNTNSVCFIERSRPRHRAHHGPQLMKSALGRIALLGLILFAISVQAQNNYQVDITNNTGYVIHYINVSPASSGNWEADVLGDQVLLNGDTFRLNLNGYSSPIFDIRLIDEDGDSYTFPGVDVTSQFVNATLADMDVP